MDVTQGRRILPEGVLVWYTLKRNWPDASVYLAALRGSLTLLVPCVCQEAARGEMGMKRRMKIGGR